MKWTASLKCGSCGYEEDRGTEFEAEDPEGVDDTPITCPNCDADDLAPLRSSIRPVSI
jgi:hypothetical protein